MGSIYLGSARSGGREARDSLRGTVVSGDTDEGCVVVTRRSMRPLHLFMHETVVGNPQMTSGKKFAGKPRMSMCLTHIRGLLKHWADKLLLDTR
jgi:hypothetical protein